MDPRKAERTAISVGSAAARYNHPFSKAVESAISKGVPPDVARRFVWWEYYINGKDDLLGDELNHKGNTAAQERGESNNYMAAEGLVALQKPRVFKEGGRSKTRRRKRSKKTLKRRQSRSRA